MILNIAKKRISVHKKSKAFIALAVMILLAASIANAAPHFVNYPGSSVRVIPGLNSRLIEQIPAPYININQIEKDWEIPGSRNPVNVSVSVVSLLTHRDICGLGPSNFKIETLKEPYISAVFIKNVLLISSAAINQSPSCDYLISLSPGTINGAMYIWDPGMYVFKLDLIQNGKELANKTFTVAV